MSITKLSLTSLIALSISGGIAGAQPIGDPEATPPPPQPAPPAPQPVVAPSVEPPPAHHHAGPDRWNAPRADEPPPDPRPSEFSIAIGAGYVLPTSLEIPNTTSVRFRFANGLTLEPNLVFAVTTQSVDTGMTISQDTTETGIGTVVRYPIVRRGKVDLEILGNLFIDSTSIDPPSDNNTTTNTTVNLGYGVGIGYWLNRHWNLSLSAQNPILTFSKEREEQGPDTVTVNSLTTIGAIFHPTVTLMIHLYN